MSGLLLVRRLKSQVATRHIIAIAVSGWDEAALADAIDSGCVAVVQKPIDFDRLLAIVREVLVQPVGSASGAAVKWRDV